jgi:hypothetical protein
MTTTVFNVNSKESLFAALGAGDSCPILINGQIGNLLSVEREDGSGKKFNVKISRFNNISRTFVTVNVFVNFGW